MKAETAKAIWSLTWRFISAFFIYLAKSATRSAGGGAADLSRAQPVENSCKTSKNIFSQGRLECGIEMGAKFRPHNDPSPVRIVLTTTPFFLILTPSALIKARFALTTTPFALTTT